MARPILYGELAERIRQAVLMYRDGWEIPSVRSLSRLHGAAPDTIRKALRLLVQQGEIASGGTTCRYTRQRTGKDQAFCRLYPAVAVLSYRTLSLGQDGYMSCLLRGLLEGLHNHGLAMTILPDRNRAHMSLVPGGIITQPGDLRFSAIVFISGAPTPMLEAVVQTGAVAMTLDCLTDVHGVDSVAVDCETEAQTAVEYLARLGHTDIVFLAPRYIVGPSHWTQGTDPDAVRFAEAMLKVKYRLGLNTSPALQHFLQLDAAGTDTTLRLAIDRLWRQNPPPTALVCFDPFTALQARQVLAGRGLCCPADVSIITRDCIDARSQSFTALTSDPLQIGMAAASQLVVRLTDQCSVPRKLQFSAPLIEGPSTGPRKVTAMFLASSTRWNRHAAQGGRCLSQTRRAAGFGHQA